MQPESYVLKQLSAFMYFFLYFCYALQGTSHAVDSLCFAFERQMK